MPAGNYWPNQFLHLERKKKDFLKQFKIVASKIRALVKYRPVLQPLQLRLKNCTIKVIKQSSPCGKGSPGVSFPGDIQKGALSYL